MINDFIHHVTGGSPGPKICPDSLGLEQSLGICTYLKHPKVILVSESSAGADAGDRHQRYFQGHQPLNLRRVFVVIDING